MARYKRRFVRRKPVLRRRRGIFRRRRIPRRKFGNGNLYCKFTRVSSVSVALDKTSVWNTAIKPGDFAEWTRLYKNFEYSKWLKIRVRVIPLQNIANNSTSAVPCYIMLPYHTIGTPTMTALDRYMSVDRAKIMRMTKAASQSYVPAVRVDVWNTIGGDAHWNKLEWRPTIFHDQGCDTTQITAGLIAFQGETTLKGTCNFNIIHDVYVKMGNQTILPFNE